MRITSIGSLLSVPLVAVNGARMTPVRAFAAAAAPPPSSAVPSRALYLLRYTYVTEILEKRGPYRAAHIQAAKDAAAKGHLVLGGATANPTDEALLVFTEKGIAESFVKSDPYVNNGLVTRWAIREWTVVAGSLFEKLVD